MAIPLPEYLKKISTITKSTKSHVCLSIKCKCKCEAFHVLKNALDEAEIQKQKEWEAILVKRFGRGFEAYSDKDGKCFMVKRNFFGKITDKLPMDEIPKFNSVTIIKVKCSSCGEEYVIFDNRKHGYNAFVENKQNENSTESVKFVQRKFNGSKENLAEVNLKIFNDATLAEFIEHTGENVSEDEYSNAFSDITIYGIVKDLNNKKVTIFAEETA